MTCIVGLVEGGKVWMGGDSAGVSGWQLTVRADEKVFINGEFVMGFTTSFRMGQLLRYALTSPELHEDQDIDHFMVVDFIDAVRACLKEGGFAKKQNEVEEGGAFLVGFRGRLFNIADDYQVGREGRPYAAVGCGADIALGSLFSTEGSDRSAPDRLRLALAAAESFSAGVRGPFVVVSR